MICSRAHTCTQQSCCLVDIYLSIYLLQCLALRMRSPPPPPPPPPPNSFVQIATTFTVAGTPMPYVSFCRQYGLLHIWCIEMSTAAVPWVEGNSSVGVCRILIGMPVSVVHTSLLYARAKKQNHNRAQTTIQLWGIWLVAAFMYYGVIMFTTELFIEEDSGMRCPQYLNSSEPSQTTEWLTTAPPTTSAINLTMYANCTELSAADYRDAFVQSVAELPVRICAVLFRVSKSKALASCAYTCTNGLHLR